MSSSRLMVVLVLCAQPLFAQQLVYNPLAQVLGPDGKPYAGAKLYVYDAGTTKSRTTYSDKALTMANPSPLVADSAGRFGPLYLRDSTSDYKLVFTTSTNVPIFTQDNIPANVLDSRLIVHDRTGAEIAAGVVPANYQYPELHLYRYGTNTAPGKTDMLPALKAAVSVAAQHDGGRIVLPNEPIGISAPLRITANRISLVGEAALSENTSSTRIMKLPGFKGEAGIIVGDNSATVMGFSARDFYLDGQHQAGSGAIFNRVTYLELRNITSEDHDGWCFEFDGIWLATMRSTLARRCGLARTGGGGYVFRPGTYRNNSNVWGYSVRGGGNQNYQMLWEADRHNSARRMAGAYFYGGVFERPADRSTTAIVAIQAARRSAFFGTHFNEIVGAAAPALLLGDRSVAGKVESLRFFGAHIQHSTNSSSDYAVSIADNVGTVEFYGPDVAVAAKSKFLDATNASAGLVKVFGSDVAADEYTDPNRVVYLVGDGATQLGFLAGGPGDAINIGSFAKQTPVKLFTRDSMGTERSIGLGTGPSGNLSDFVNTWPRVPPATSAPSNPAVGTIALADRVKWDPAMIGSGGAYWVWWDGEAWKRLADQAQ